MSAETFTPPSATEFKARPTVETRRGTEVHSNHGDRLVNMANRIASFMDRVKGRGTGAAEAAQDTFEQGRQLLRTTGEKAIGVAKKTLDVAGTTALLGLEFGVGAAVLTGEAAARGAKKVAEAAGNGLDKANAWAEDKADKFDAALTRGAAKAGEWVDTKIDAVRAKGTELRESATGKYEAVRGFFRDRAETAKLNMQKLRRNWIAGYSRTRRGALQTVESGKAFAQETGENVKHNARVVRRTGQMALAHYRANAVPVMPR